MSTRQHTKPGAARPPAGKHETGSRRGTGSEHGVDSEHGTGSRRTGSEHGVDPRRTIGRLGEDLAASHLTRLGFSTLARNVRTRHGEIDLIVFDGKALVFVEVKTRSAGFGGRPIRPDQEPLPWLRPRQRARLRRLARAWLSDERHERPSARTIRFDAVGVIVDERGRLLRLDHVEAAW